MTAEDFMDLPPARKAKIAGQLGFEIPDVEPDAIDWTEVTEAVEVEDVADNAETYAASENDFDFDGDDDDYEYEDGD